MTNKIFAITINHHNEQETHEVYARMDDAETHQQIHNNILNQQEPVEIKQYELQDSQPFFVSQISTYFSYNTEYNTISELFFTIDSSAIMNSIPENIVDTVLTQNNTGYETFRVRVFGRTQDEAQEKYSTLRKNIISVPTILLTSTNRENTQTTLPVGKIYVVTNTQTGQIVAAYTTAEHAQKEVELNEHKYNETFYIEEKIITEEEPKLYFSLQTNYTVMNTTKHCTQTIKLIVAAAQPQDKTTRVEERITEVITYGETYQETQQKNQKLREKR